METTESIQLVKEQLKIQCTELRRRKQENQRLNEKIQNLLQLNYRKINDLQKEVAIKEEQIKDAENQAWAARIARHVGKKGDENDEDGPEELIYQDPLLLEKIEKLKRREINLSQKMEESKKVNAKNRKDKALLLKELKRLRKELETIDALNGQIGRLKEEIQKRPEKNSLEMEQLLKEKDGLIENYEKMLYGDMEPGEEGMLPSEIIMDLKMELNDLMGERKRMILDLDQLNEYVGQLETKIALSEEKESKGKMDHRSQVENRAAATLEFSSGLEGFLITYSDMITLLLAIFILFLAVSQIDPNKLFDSLSSWQDRKVRVDKKNYYLTAEEWDMLQWISGESEKHQAPYDTFIPGDRATVPIRLQADDYFAPGSADLKDNAENKIIAALGDQYQEGLKEVRVLGHTDSVPLKDKSVYETNWELSAARAARVARVLIQKLNIPPEKVAATGYGEFRPEVKDETNDKARARNRRVEVVLIKDKDVLAEEKSKGTKLTPLKKDAGISKKDAAAAESPAAGSVPVQPTGN